MAFSYVYVCNVEYMPVCLLPCLCLLCPAHITDIIDILMNTCAVATCCFFSLGLRPFLLLHSCVLSQLQPNGLCQPKTVRPLICVTLVFYTYVCNAHLSMVSQLGHWELTITMCLIIHEKSE